MVIFRSMNVLVIDSLLKTKKNIHWLIHVVEAISANLRVAENHLGGT